MQVYRFRVAGPLRPGVRGQRRRGFVLLDAILALAAAAMLVVYGLSLMMTTSSASDGARQTTIAYNAARQAIENVRSFHGAKLADGTYFTAGAKLPDGTAVDGTPNMAVVGPLPQIEQMSGGWATLQVKTLKSTGPSLMKQVWVTIGWRSGGQLHNRSITVTTLVAAGGVAP